MKQAVKKNESTAILMPLSLLSKLQLNEEGKKKMRNADKHVLAETELVWIILNIPGVTQCQIHRRQIPCFGPEPDDMIDIMTGPSEFDPATWLPKQKTYVQDHEKTYRGHVRLGADQFLYFQ